MEACELRWRFVDRVDAFDPWHAIAGRKVVSFEEYSLLKPFGRQGAFPESLVLEACVAMGGWLVAASSGFSLCGTLSEVRRFEWEGPAGMGQVIELAAQVRGRRGDEIDLECRADGPDRHIAHGEISLALLPADGLLAASVLEATWKELYGAA